MKGVKGTSRLEELPAGGMCQYRVKLTSPAGIVGGFESPLPHHLRVEPTHQRIGGRTMTCRPASQVPFV